MPFTVYPGDEIKRKISIINAQYSYVMFHKISHEVLAEAFQEDGL